MDDKHQHSMMLSIVAIVAVVGVLGVGLAVISANNQNSQALAGNAMCGTYCCGTGFSEECTGYEINGSCYNGTWVNETVCTNYCNNCLQEPLAPRVALR